MTSKTVGPVSSETLALLFDETSTRYELMDGVLQAKPGGSLFHGMMISWLCSLLEQQIDADHVVVADAHSKLDDRNYLRPDVAVLKLEDAEPWKYIQPGHWPQLCIEVQSPPAQSTDELLKKCETFHAQGVPYCWVIDPESRNVWEYHKGHAPQLVHEPEPLTAGSVTIDTQDLWRGLKGKRGNRLPSGW